MSTTHEADQLAEKPIMTVAETGRLLGCDARTVSRAIEDGTIKSVKIGRRILVLREPLMRMLRGEAS